MAGKEIMQTQMKHEININIKHKASSNCCSDDNITEYDIDARQKL